MGLHPCEKMPRPATSIAWPSRTYMSGSCTSQSDHQCSILSMHAACEDLVHVTAASIRMSTRSTTTLLVDVYQTLIRIDATPLRVRSLEARGWTAVASYLRRAGVTISGATLSELYRLRRDAWYASKANPKTRHHNFKTLLEGIFKTSLQIRVSAALLNSSITVYRSAARGRLKLYPGALDALTTLRQRYRLAVASYSQSCFAQAELSELGLADFFFASIYSSDIGYRKTSGLFYRRCLRAVRRPAASCLMIGDNYEEDVRSPGHLGIKSIWVRNPVTASRTDPSAVKNSIPIGKIDKLPAVIERLLT